MSNIDKQALNQEKIEWLNKLADMEYCKSNPGHWLMSLKDTNMLAKLALRSVALLDEMEAADALNKHLELAIRRAEGCSEALRRKLEAAEERIAELSELPMKSDVEKKPQNTLSGRPVYLGDGSDAKETLIAGKRDIHRYGSLITDKAWKGD
nr:MAG TPA: Ead/Ea22-like protein [Caudoviricetes sp.]